MWYTELDGESLLRRGSRCITCCVFTIVLTGNRTKRQNPFYLVFTGMNVIGSGVSTVYAPSWRSCRVLVKSVFAAALRKGMEPRPSCLCVLSKFAKRIFVAVIVVREHDTGM